MLSLLQYCSREFFLENPHNNEMSYKYLHLIWTWIFPIIQSCTRILVNTHTQQFNKIFVPIVFCLSEFCMNIFIRTFTQYLQKTHQKLHLECIYLNPCSFNRIPQIYIYIFQGPIASSSLTQSFFSSSGYTFSFG